MAGAVSVGTVWGQTPTGCRAGGQLRRFKEGDHPYALALVNPKGGFYAEYAVVKADNVSPTRREPPLSLSTRPAHPIPPASRQSESSPESSLNRTHQPPP